MVPMELRERRAQREQRAKLDQAGSPDPRDQEEIREALEQKGQRATPVHPVKMELFPVGMIKE